MDSHSQKGLVESNFLVPPDDCDETTLDNKAHDKTNDETQDMEQEEAQDPFFLNKDLQDWSLHRLHKDGIVDSPPNPTHLGARDSVLRSKLGKSKILRGSNLQVPNMPVFKVFVDEEKRMMVCKPEGHEDSSSLQPYYVQLHEKYFMTEQELTEHLSENFGVENLKELILMGTAPNKKIDAIKKILIDKVSKEICSVLYFQRGKGKEWISKVMSSDVSIAAKHVLKRENYYHSFCLALRNTQRVCIPQEDHEMFGQALSGRFQDILPAEIIGLLNGSTTDATIEEQKIGGNDVKNEDRLKLERRLLGEDYEMD